MKQDGTLDALTKKYIIDLKADEEPEAIEMPKVEGAETLKVAVTGDLPPLDLITAVLAEISKRIGKNIELVSVDSEDISVTDSYFVDESLHVDKK